ncbi:hemolymph lipopolysaccharide-binding protein-like [Zootermopsis nevadensis]|uniref:Hemolymph lipopolysaccharide-binding protein n=1 Tax=Zootermopsis nevadensis TaxID=136037 RepID=A0A067R5P8_ZOONE|nr:hemolymph lipopolysaccharide-binding protein-like [Zootermopsis nevadensis]XP_021923356.1 hemolymph lipopolysaccharide-binding protein-like [Zootermopsis nevadensis]XP_021923357.1 hemolymph lipopolysaccharide-binding protein-like [Zootermopsis nevadensis]KDR17639.1 Hemolymph lipopolysaccharide-binding protein [Zootermopsis nevadensis]
MEKIWSCLMLVLASLCAVHMKPLDDERHRALIRSGYVHYPGAGYYRLAKKPASWGEGRRNCQQEGAILSIVNSPSEAGILKALYLSEGLTKLEKYENDDISEISRDSNSTENPPIPTSGTIHIGFHDLFVEGEYLTVRGEPIIATGFVRWKPGYPVSDDLHNCGAFDTNQFILDIPCELELPYVCEISEL